MVNLGMRKKRLEMHKVQKGIWMSTSEPNFKKEPGAWYTWLATQLPMLQKSIKHERLGNRRMIKKILDLHLGTDVILTSSGHWSVAGVLESGYFIFDEERQQKNFFTVHSVTKLEVCEHDGLEILLHVPREET